MLNDLPIEPKLIFSKIEEEWDGPLDHELVDRICKADEDQLLVVRSAWPQIKTSITPSMKSDRDGGFGLRPIIKPSPASEPHIEVERTSLMSLHCDEIILDTNLLFPFGSAISEPNDWALLNSVSFHESERINLRKTLTALIDLRALIEGNAIRFAHLRGSSRELSEKSLTDDATPVVMSWIQQGKLPKIFGNELSEFETFIKASHLPFDMLGSLHLATTGHGTPTWWNPLEANLWEAMIQGRAFGRSPSRVQTLTSLSLPGLGAKTKEIALIRSSDEHFAMWREAMKAGLDQIEELRADDPEHIKQSAINSFSRSLNNDLKRLIGSIDKSRSLRGKFSGFRDLVVTGIGTAGGAAIASSPDIIPAAVASALSAGVAGTLSDYLTSRESARIDRAMWDLAISIDA